MEKVITSQRPEPLLENSRISSHFVAGQLKHESPAEMENEN
jgi:hypothetical protein